MLRRALHDLVIELGYCAQGCDHVVVLDVCFTAWAEAQHRLSVSRSVDRFDDGDVAPFQNRLDLRLIEAIFVIVKVGIFSIFELLIDLRVRISGNDINLKSRIQFLKILDFLEKLGLKLKRKRLHLDQKMRLKPLMEYDSENVRQQIRPFGFVST